MITLSCVETHVLILNAVVLARWSIIRLRNASAPSQFSLFFSLVNLDAGSSHQYFFVPLSCAPFLRCIFRGGDEI